MDKVAEVLQENSFTSNIGRDCGQHFWRKFLIFALVFLTVWNFTKVPYYIQFNKDGDTDYEKGGLTGSINLYYWLDGFKSSKLRAPACNFLLVHVAFGSTVLIMMALSLVKTAWRKKYGNYFFFFAVCLSVHTVPAAILMPQLPLRILFTFTCVWVFVSAIFGFKTLREYDTLGPEKAEHHLLIEYSLITLGAYGAGFAEFTGIFSKIKYRLSTGEWRQYGDVPHPLFGHTLYDKLPEKVGMTFFFVFITIVWFWWPIKIVSIDTDVSATKKDGKDGVANENTTLL